MISTTNKSTTFTRTLMVTAITLAISACQTTKEDIAESDFEHWSVEKTLKGCEQNRAACFDLLSTSTVQKRLRVEQKIALCKQYKALVTTLCPKALVAEAKHVEIVKPLLPNNNFEIDYQQALAFDDIYKRIHALERVTANNDKHRVKLGVSLTINALLANEPTDKYTNKLFSLKDVTVLSHEMQSVVYWQASLVNRDKTIRVSNKVKNIVNWACHNQRADIYSGNTEKVIYDHFANSCFVFFKYFALNGVVSEKVINKANKIGLKGVNTALMSSIYLDFMPEFDFKANDEITKQYFEIFNGMMTIKGLNLKSLIKS